MSSIFEKYSELGGIFYGDKNEFLGKLSKVKAFIFDWDGVFNNGRKTDDKGSDFSEVDSMGINLLRFGYWLKNGHIPYTAIITGMNNGIAQYFAGREHFNNIFFGFKNKLDAWQIIQEEQQLKAEETAFIFDDILDFGVAGKSGLRIMVRRRSNPLLNEFAIQNKLVDYLTAADGGNHAIRESSELLLGMQENYNEVVKNRMSYSEAYKDYSKQRMAIQTIGIAWK